MAAIDPAQPDAAEAVLRDLIDRGRAAWPEIQLAPATFLAFAAARVTVDAPGDGAASLLAAVERLRADDLHLVCACLAGDARALAAFDELLQRVVGAALARMGAAPAERAEIAQQVRARLLVPEPGEPARLGEYGGRGDLRGFVRAVAVRTFLNARRGARRDILVDDDAALERLAESGEDPELAVMRQRYRAEFGRAFRAAVDALPERDRTFLRYAFVDGLGLDELASVHKISRATAHRWLVKAREALAAAVEAELRAELRVTPSEFHSIRRLVQSDVELSLRRVFDR
jgi:RNA polymerase sigma-70 factor (ECF subfamily)